VATSPDQRREQVRLAKARAAERSKLITKLERWAVAGHAAARAALDLARSLPDTPSDTPSDTVSDTPSVLLKTKALTLSAPIVLDSTTRARRRRSKIVEGELPGTDVSRGKVWQETEALATLYRQLFSRPCFVNETVVKIVGGWLKRRTLDDARRLLYLRASVPAWNKATGREETWTKGSLQGLFDERAVYAGKQDETLFENLQRRFVAIPTRVKEILDGNGDARLFEAAGWNGSPERPDHGGVVPAARPIPVGLFRPE